MSFIDELKAVEEWFIEAIKEIEDDLPKFLPEITLISEFIPGLPAWVPQVLSAIPKMVAALEQAIPTSGSGGIKLAALTAGTRSMCNALDGVDVVASNSTFNKIQSVVEVIAAKTVAAANVNKPDTSRAGDLPPIQ